MSSRRQHALLLVTAATLAVAFSPLSRSAENPAEVLELPTVEVIGTTPLPGLGVPLRDVPANVQVFTSRDIGRQRQTNLTDFLDQNPTSVTSNAAQGNPFQPDVSFRGFTASPLLGLPQGMSVFYDGVRVNEPFGDVVNWDLIPQGAISSIQLLPGSNPVFGPNTLGGALAIYTKSGSEYPGGSIEAYGGSFGRKAVELEYGAKRGNWDVFVTGNYFDDHGWAEHNPSRVKQLFGKVGHQTDTSDLDLTLTTANNRLEGTQTLPRSFLDDIRQAYTFPDVNTNKVTLVTLKGSRFLSDGLLLGGNVYHRNYRNSNVSSNVNDAFGDVDPITGEMDRIQATNDRSRIDQKSFGFGVQLTMTGALAGRKNQFIVGASLDHGRAHFTQDVQAAEFTASRATLGIDDFELATDARTTNRYYGVFIVDTLNLSPRWSMTVSGRYNRARVTIEDQTGAAPLLNGEHRYSRLNPSVGCAFNPNPALTAFAAYSEGMRAPTPIELTCADPEAPCKLPNNFLADPALAKVVARTVEVGTRGKWAALAEWSAAAYRTELFDDIQFISSGAAATNAGYFQNVGRTRRQGIELSLSVALHALKASARYAYMDATFRSAFLEHSPSNSTADEDGNISVRPGNTIPGLPKHGFKLRFDYEVDERLSFGGNLVYNSGVYARGDENNQDSGGKVPGFTVVNLDARYGLGRGVELFARVNNLFDRRYSNFAILGRNFFTGPNHAFAPDDAVNEQFRGIGAPRGAWVGVRYRWL